MSKKWMIGVDLWDSNCKCADETIDHEILITCDSYEDAISKFKEIVSEHQDEEEKE